MAKYSLLADEKQHVVYGGRYIHSKNLPLKGETVVKNPSEGRQLTF